MYIVKKIHYYIFLFFLGSILGWCSEVIFNLMINHQLVNPGTLFLCWCPIYGVAAVIIDLITKKEYKWWQNALIICVVSVIDEYIAAVISEEVFNHKLWDYSNYFMNFQGRICLGMALLFTIAGLFAVYIFIPKSKQIYKTKHKIIKKYNYILTTIFVLNIIIECII